MRILIVEDDMTSRVFMEKHLSKYGECDIALNGVEAIEKVEAAIKEEPYSLICLDVMMPKVDGIKALELIREMENKACITNSKVIITTALNDQDTVKDAYKLGIDAYAWKPIDLKEFDTVLKDIDII